MMWVRHWPKPASGCLPLNDHDRAGFCEVSAKSMQLSYVSDEPVGQRQRASRSSFRYGGLVRSAQSPPPKNTLELAQGMSASTRQCPMQGRMSVQLSCTETISGFQIDSRRHPASLRQPAPNVRRLHVSLPRTGPASAVLQIGRQPPWVS